MFYEIKTHGSCLLTQFFCTHTYYTFCFYKIKTRRIFIPRNFFNDKIFPIYSIYTCRIQLGVWHKLNYHMYKEHRIGDVSCTFPVYTGNLVLWTCTLIFQLHQHKIQTCKVLQAYYDQRYIPCIQPPNHFPLTISYIASQLATMVNKGGYKSGKDN